MTKNTNALESSADKETQYFFFSNSVWEIRKEGIKKFEGDISEKLKSKTIEFSPELDDTHFKISQLEDRGFDIEIIKKDNMFFNFLINTSRVHWREELEFFYEGKSALEAERYSSDNKFNIAGPNLTKEQAQEHKNHLVNKIFSIGYLLHNYKTYNKPWCVFAVDYNATKFGGNRGASGKTFCFESITRIFKNRVYLNGRDPKLTQNDFIYHDVTEDTDCILIDDAARNLNFDFFISSITGSLQVNAKYKESVEIPFEKSPKFVITSGFAPIKPDPSLLRRMLYVQFSDYYHDERGYSGETYLQCRRVLDDFEGNIFFNDFAHSDFNDFYNFCAQCVQFYLSYDGKINPPIN